MRTLATVLLVACSAAACRAGPRVPGSPFSSGGFLAPLSQAEEAHDDLLRADLARADSVARLGYARGLGAALASDVVYLRGGLPLVRGRDAAMAIAVAESVGAATTVRWQPVRAEASRDGGSGYSYGYTVYSAAQPAAPAVRIDRYIAFWRRDAGGWRIVAYAETYGSPPAPLALPAAARSAVLRDSLLAPAGGALEAMRVADVEFSRDAGALGTGLAFGRYAADDAQVFSAPGEFISGPAAITQSFGPASGDNNLVWHPVAGEVSSAGDLGFTAGNAVFSTGRGAGVARLGYSKYLTVWKKQRDGRWRYVVDGGSARPAP